MKNRSFYLIYLSFCLLFTHILYASSHKQHSPFHKQEHKPTKTLAQQTIQISIHNIKDYGLKKIVQIKLTNSQNQQPIQLIDLKEIHTEKIHLLIIDDSLQDYSHVHPRPLSTPGLYEFEWSPQNPTNYHMWADLFPMATQTQEYIKTKLVSGKKRLSVSKKSSFTSTIDGYTFTLSFDQKNLRAGHTALGKIIVTDSKGIPVNKLEPIMGAFAHIVGFFEDRKTIIHVHPLGEEPSKATDRGGPELQFHIQLPKPGFIKLFAQARIGGKEFFAPFGIIVKE